MRVDRLPYEELPEPTRQALQQRFGAHCPRADMETGNSAAFASVFFPAAGAPEFVKGLPLDHERIGELEAEATVNPFLPAFAPRVLWRHVAGGWLMIGFQGLTATPWAWFADDSDHLGPVAAALRELSLLPAPDGVRLTPWDRWGEYCDPADEGLLTGDRLVHSDPAATNFMVERGGRVWMIDWAWAMRGPAWIDAALWGFRLLLDGKQSVEDAARWARTIPAFAKAPREGVRVLAEAEARSWEDWREHGMTELDETITAARAWAAHWR
ncbi:aminoglycoside phosphotransferase [Streptomyces sp. NBC_01343]|uniref:aminoglycoside phosphotransferase n=1 Tax=Streptomyces sp. NBC_01343 TaxID=2903832 RepID=UPI002E1156DD|nr:aminoglycoside phosphotransferase [Streptomyces sp. NBC_01343]